MTSPTPRSRHRECQPPRLSEGLARHRRPRPRRRVRCPSARALAAYATGAGARCPAASSTTRMSSSRSTRAASSRSSRIAPKWAPARAPACRWSLPTSSKPIGRASRSCSRPATRRNTATRTPTARAACAISSSRCAQCGAAGAADARNGGGAALGCRPSPRSRRRTTRSSTSLPGASSAMASLPPQRARCRPRRRSDQAQGRGRLPLYRQGQCPDRRSLRHHDRRARSTASTPSCPA